MLFRIDIGEKLDLSKFRKYAKVYMGTMRELTFDIFLKDYKVVIQVNQVDDKAYQLVTLFIYEKIRVMQDLVRYQLMTPANDNRFQEVKVIHDLFKHGEFSATLDCTNTEEATDKICQLIKVIHKINNLIAFL